MRGSQYSDGRAAHFRAATTVVEDRCPLSLDSGSNEGRQLGAERTLEVVTPLGLSRF